MLADPVGSFPDLLGPGSKLGGKSGVQWMMKWPYALPNILGAMFLFNAAIIVTFGLEEVSWMYHVSNSG